MRIPCATLICLVVITAGPEAQRASTAPETFTANAHVKGPIAASVAPIQIHIESYTSQTSYVAVENGLKYGGYPSFLTALRQAPEVGYLALGKQKYAIRLARERTTPKGRTIVVITDKPVFFVGGGFENSKPKAGYEIALVQMTVDEAGTGSGTMAAAARVKPGGETGVQVDDYADEPIKLEAVVRKPE